MMTDLSTLDHSIFDKDKLDKALNQVIPSQDSNAVVLMADKTGVKAAVHFTKGEHWDVDGIYIHNWSGGDDVLGRVVYHW